MIFIWVWVFDLLRVAQLNCRIFISFFIKSSNIFYHSKAKAYFCIEFTDKMTNRYEELINAFELKLRKLISEYQSLQNQNAELKAELDRKHTDLMFAHQEVLELRKNYDHLRIARNLGVTEEDRSDSKQRINKMVREIDKCLALLDE